MEEKAKEAFFDELYRLDDEESGEEDTSNATATLSRSRFHKAGSLVRATTPRNRLFHSSRTNHILERTMSAPLLETSTSFTNQLNPILRTSPSPDMVMSTMALEEQDLKAIVPSTATSRQNQKRKRGQSLQSMPESQQIFRGLAFYFLPNNDIASARSFRIKKALEWGAVWIKEWRVGITHVVVDKGLCYQDVLKFLKLDSLPSDVILVNEGYPAECLTFRYLVNAEQARHRVAGHADALLAQQPPTPVPTSDMSLPLKPDKGRTHQASTPARTEESTQNPLIKNHEDVVLVPEAHQALSTEPKLTELPFDALNEAIEVARTIKDFPIDFDEDEARQGSIDESEEDLQSEDEEMLKPRSKKGSYDKPWQQNFSCMSKHDGTGKSENPNAGTIEVLQNMAEYYERDQDHWRLTAYRRAIAALRKEGRKITSAKEAFAIPFVGQRLAAKIEEIVWTNKLRRLDNTDSGPDEKAFQLFVNIYGVGLAQATKWIDQGYRTIGDLLSKAQLTKNQKIGIERFDDFETRIPRQEMQRHDKYVREFIGSIDNDVQITIGGSYRRGAANSGDVDFIVTKPDCPIETLRTIVLETVIPRLFKSGYLKVGLATTAKEDGTKWHGAAALPGTSVWRRIDFLLVPWEEIGAALIYFTGNDIFNRSIRLLASKKGMRLNQRGLWRDVMRGNNRERITQGTLIEGKSEKKIFELLGVPWRPPEHRIC